jgi:hypothetical protein
MHQKADFPPGVLVNLDTHSLGYGKARRPKTAGRCSSASLRRNVSQFTPKGDPDTTQNADA